MQKMITPDKRTKQMWDQIVQKVTGARTASGPVQRSNEPTVLLVVDDSRSAAVRQQDEFYRQRAQANRLAEKMQVAHQLHAAAPGNLLGKTVYVNDPELPYHMRFYPHG